MIFSIFDSVKSQQGQLCTDEIFFRTINSEKVISRCKKIAAEEDHDKQNILKKDLPIVTWQAFFGDKSRTNENAQPSGLYMMDLDGIENPAEAWKRIEARGPEKFGILIAHKTPSTHGLRIVAKNREGLETIVANQEWFAAQFPEFDFDTVVKDMARSSFLVPGSYFYYTDMNVFKDMGPIYIKRGVTASLGVTEGEGGEEEVLTLGTQDLGTYKKYGTKWFCVRRMTDLFGTEGELFTDADLKYQNIDIRELALHWLRLNGYTLERGSRNSSLFALACNLRYVCDFSADLMLACLPVVLPRAEHAAIVASALKRERIVGVPKTMREAIASLKESKASEDEGFEDNVFNHLQSQHDMMATEKLPPIFRQFVGCAPTDFRKATVVALLPMLGTLGSRLRARYLDGKMHSPSFQCEIEAPMASGKSFARDLFDAVMGPLFEHERELRAKEAEYDAKVKAAKNAKEQPEVETYPIRILGTRLSISALMERMYNAKGCHVFSFDEEVRNVLDSVKAGGYGDIRALLRCAFDNSNFGQEYRSEGSSKRYLPILYNTLHCGTPAEYRRLYNNAEDGTITRIIFVELPDQSFKKMPVFKKLSYWQQKDVKKAIDKLSHITMIDDKVQPEHELTEITFLNEWADGWLERMRLLAERFGNLSLDTYRKRAAVCGFRAGMIAWFLFGKDSDINRKKTVEFAEMVAEQMCVTLMQRYEIVEMSNSIWYKQVWNKLNDEFALDQLKQAIEECKAKALPKQVVYCWKSKNFIVKTGDNKFKKNVK